MRRVTTAMPLMLLLALAACRSSESTGPKRAPRVRVAAIRRGVIEDVIRLSGRVAPPPDHDAVLAALVPGRIESVRVTDGAAVKRGQIVARLETETLDGAVRAAQKEEARWTAEASFRTQAAERTKALFAQGVTSKEDSDADEAQATAASTSLSQAQVALEEARRRRGWADVRAPFDGVVTRVIRQAGEPVDGTPATPILEVAAPSPLEIEAGSMPADLGRIRAGGEARVYTRGTSEPFPAKVARLSRAVDGASGIAAVRIALDPPSPALVLGATVEVRIVVGRHEAALLAPLEAVRRGDGGEAEVFTAGGGKASLKKVELGLRDDRDVEILSGVGEGDLVVVDDPLGLEDGASIEPAGP